ncbi:hypothetical protein [Fischerella thermalis]|jgi:hypothetical protein|uniref:Uncharacterized protein n=1 Tax=Fischerella thermalis JSC-11 TaxID=741277 RepID=G6FV88_9CYAN|nr:hypothetical protein [Fischerella thermalis]EHC12143.1 hypothetical protein FJSC11DRAFT_2785 [Fischerella thermalis JSC-11]
MYWRILCHDSSLRLPMTAKKALLNQNMNLQFTDGIIRSNATSGQGFGI